MLEISGRCTPTNIMNGGNRECDGYGVLINKNVVPSPLANSLSRIQRRQKVINTERSCYSR